MLLFDVCFDSFTVSGLLQLILVATNIPVPGAVLAPHHKSIQSRANIAKHDHSHNQPNNVGSSSIDGLEPIWQTIFWCSLLEIFAGIGESAS